MFWFLIIEGLFSKQNTMQMALKKIKIHYIRTLQKVENGNFTCSLRHNFVPLHIYETLSLLQVPGDVKSWLRVTSEIHVHWSIKNNVYSIIVFKNISGKIIQNTSKIRYQEIYFIIVTCIQIYTNCRFVYTWRRLI